MRVGLIADLHGNLVALDAVLRELEGERVDEILCLGDVAVGPQPGETLDRVRATGCRVVMGNWDAYFLDGFPAWSNDIGQKLVEIGAWWAEQLSPAQREYLRSFESTLELRLDGRATLLAFHGSPRSYEEGIFATTPEEQVEVMLSGVRAPLLAGAHTHFQLLRRHAECVIVNPGSVGLPFRGRGTVMTIAPWAEYGIVTLDGDRLAVDLRRTAFDVEAFVRLMRESGMPHAEWWTSLWTEP